MGRRRGAERDVERDREGRNRRRAKFRDAKVATFEVLGYDPCRVVSEIAPGWLPKPLRIGPRRQDQTGYAAGWDDGFEAGWDERGRATGGREGLGDERGRAAGGSGAWASGEAAARGPGSLSEPSGAGALVLGRDVALAALEGLLAALARGIGGDDARRAAVVLEAALAGATRRRGSL